MAGLLSFSLSIFLPHSRTKLFISSLNSVLRYVVKCDLRYAVNVTVYSGVQSTPMVFIFMGHNIDPQVVLFRPSTRSLGLYLQGSNLRPPFQLCGCP